MSSEPMTTILRPEHPRPDFVRETFFNLNGVWQFAFDDDDQGLAAGWMKPGVRCRWRSPSHSPTRPGSADSARRMKSIQ